MTYSINGVALDNSSGWRVIEDTTLLPHVSYRVTVAQQHSRDGVEYFPTTREPVTLKLIVGCDPAHADDVLALFSTPSLEVRDTERPGLVAIGRLLSTAPVFDRPEASMWVQEFSVGVAEGCWRSDWVESPKSNAASGGVYHSLFSGLSAPVQDANVFVSGPITNPRVTDSQGSFFALTGSIAAGEELLFESGTGRAFRVLADASQVEVSGLVDYGGPRGVFEITPRFPTPTDPAVREGRVRLTQSSFGSGAGVHVYGQSAHLF